MAYRYSKEDNTLIIDGWEKGIAQSPYSGISNIRNINTNYYAGVAYVNYQRQAASTPSFSANRVTLDNFNSGAVSTGATTVSYSHTVGTGYYPLLIVATQVQSTDTISSVTYGGVAMTQIGSSVAGSDATQKIALYYLLNPTAGAGTITVTRNGSTNSMSASSVSYFNVSQVSFPDAVTSNTGTTSVTTTFTTTADNTYVLCYAASTDIIAGTGSVLIGRTVAPTVTTTFTSTTTWTAPIGVTSVTAEVWAGGGAGGSGEVGGLHVGAGGGGGGGAYSKKNTISVTAGTPYTVTVGVGGPVSGPGNGGDSWFSTSGTVLAKGGVVGGDSTGAGNVPGAGGAGGAAGSGIGDTKYSGGAGAGGSRDNYGGGGGGGADSGGAGGAASTSTAGAAGSGGIAGAGGTGIISPATSAGNPGNVAGGGGSGGYGVSGARSLGARGQVKLTYTIPRLGLFSSNANPKTPAGSVSMQTSTNDTGSSVGQIMLGVAPKLVTMGNPVSKAVSPQGLIYIQDDNGSIWKQSAVNSSVFNYLSDGTGRLKHGNAGIAYFNNYLAVFGSGVIEFCGDGTNDTGIISTNWNKNGLGVFGKNTAVFTTDFVDFPNSISLVYPDYLAGLPKFQVGDPITFTTTGSLPLPLAINTTYYVARLSPVATVYIATSEANVFQNFTGNVSSGATSATLATAWTGTTGTYAVLFSDLQLKNATLTNGSTSVTWTGGLSATVASTFSVVITLTSDGTGTQTIVDNAAILPLGNCTNLSVNFVGSSPYNSATFNSGNGILGYYTNPSGTLITGIWQGATGLYNIVMANGQKVPANFTNGSAVINFLSPVSNIGYGDGTNWTIELVDTSVTNYKPYVSKVDGSLLFANGQFLGRIAETSDPNITFNPTIGQSYSVSVGVTALPEQTTDTIVDMVDLKSELIVAGQKDVYTWDYLSASTSAPTPIGEPIKSIKNLLSNIYILAGEKGNMYVTNGYSAQLLFKMPDFIAGVIDPVWKWGDMMIHRSRIFFQALAQNTSGTNLLAGIFSLIVSPSMLGEQAGGLVMEAQNSYGLTPASGALQTGLLIDNEPSSNGQDSYYSAWSLGSIEDSYFQDINDSLVISAINATAAGQTFTALVNGTLNTCAFYLSKAGSPTGNAVAKIYNLTGTYGTDAIPTGSALATSDPFSVSTLTSDYQQISFSFGGSNSLALVAGTTYGVVFEYLGASGGSDYINLRQDDNGIHAGNSFFFFDGEWDSANPDVLFSVSISETGGIDYNDTSLWQNFEPTIETDIIPISSILYKKTLGNIEFKLDRPMVDGDKIRVYQRASLTDTYTLMGTTTSAVLSDYYQSNIYQQQWIQFKIELACASSDSSFIPLREIRIQTIAQ